MSQWTHLAGLIRLDNIGHVLIRRAPGFDLNKIAEESIKEAMGNICNWDSPMGDWNKCTVPIGSEGSLQYELRVAPTKEGDNSLNWGYISIWGDLRDYGLEDYPKLKEWFERSMRNLERKIEYDFQHASPEVKVKELMSRFLIRNAVLAIDIENHPSRLFLSYESGDSKVTEAEGLKPEEVQGT
jgi:hypothetical protein